MKIPTIVLTLVLAAGAVEAAQQRESRIVAGTIVDQSGRAVKSAQLSLTGVSGEQTAVTTEDGRFRFAVPREPVVLRVEGKFIVPLQKPIAETEPSEDLLVEIHFRIPTLHDSVVIMASSLEPGFDRRNDTIFKETLFSRDDQVFHTLDAGINVGQHEGGGKSLEVRRFGFNMDHGGVSGGLKVLVDNVQQNHSTQGHGQGYLGQLKSLTPELVEEVTMINGPFSAEYGDFSGLGVVHIRLREKLDDLLNARLQAGSFDTVRGFVGYSPALAKVDSVLAYEGSRTDGPFHNPLRYARDNLTGNFTLRLNEREHLGFKMNAGRNDFYSSGQLPLDEIAAGRLDRFDAIDPFGGGRVRSALAGVYYRKDSASGDMFKLDGFISRSLFDLYSNFTFYLEDEINGDEFQQHDSRLQQGVNAQFLHPYRLWGGQALLTVGGNFHGNQINVGLFPSVARNPVGIRTKGLAHVENAAGYIQQGIELWGNRLHLEGGLRFDYFRFNVDDLVDPAFSGSQDAGRLQPKLNVAFRPVRRLPVSFHVNYGRGISSQDARGIVQRPDGEKISTTDFYQTGFSFGPKRVSFAADLFLIDRSNEQVYIPDDGSIELKGPSRAYGFELKTSIELARHLSFNAGMTQVTNAYYRGTLPRVYVDSAPHLVANAGLTLGNWRGYFTSLRFRYINSYRLDGVDPGIRASGLTVLDFGLRKQLSSRIDFNLAIDNLTDKNYYETQNFFASRVRPGDPVIERIHATPGYPIGFTVGLTFHLEK